MAACGVASVEKTPAGSTCSPSTRPPETKAVIQRDTSSTFVKIEPAGHDAALFALGRMTAGFPFTTSWPCASG